MRKIIKLGAIGLVTLAFIGCGDTYADNADTSVALKSLTKTSSFLIDTSGKALYTFDNDTLNTSNCDATCQSTWSLFRGADTSNDDIKVLTGTDHLAYRKHPMYTFTNDTAVEDTNGDDVNGIWHLIYAASADTQSKLSTATMTQTYLTDKDGRALYTFDNDEINVSNCYDTCEDTWPVYYNANVGSVPSGFSSSGFTSFDRNASAKAGISKQTAYKGKPLYYFTADNETSGSFKGDWVKGVWHLVEVSAVKTTQVIDNTVAIASGKTKYDSTCVACHSTNGSGGIGPDLRSLSADSIKSKLTAFKASGAGTMGGVASNLSDEEITNLSLYVETL